MFDMFDKNGNSLIDLNEFLISLSSILFIQHYSSSNDHNLKSTDQQIKFLIVIKDWFSIDFQ